MDSTSALLASLDPPSLKSLREKLLVADVPEEISELKIVQKVADSLTFASSSDVPDAIRVVKELSRIAIKYRAAVAAHPDSVGAVVALDNNMVPILRALGAFVDLSNRRELHEGLNSDKELRKWLPFVLTVCYFVNEKGLLGTDLMQSVVLSEDLLDACVALTQVEDREKLLSKYVAQIVALCSQDVEKDEWAATRSVHKHVMLQVVEQVSFPYLGGDLLGRLLALTFPLVDDLADATQVVGARLLRHIVRNVTPTELRWYSDVLLEVLHTAIVSRKPDTLDVLLDCLVESLDKVSPPGELKHYDRFMPRLLNDTSLCSDVAIRVVFVRHLRVLVARQGPPHSLNVIRYLQPLLKVLVAGFESVNVTLLMESLEALRATVLSAWPRIAPHTESILVGVLRTVAFCEIFDAGAEFTPTLKEKEQLLAVCEDVLDLLDQVNAGDAVVKNMLVLVGDQSPKLSPFCDRMHSKWESQ